ncbi:MAG: thermonuclease family protein [Chloroflexi bacterium]|nr:thermonuclease family protein [Chloroflexota bacterium]
MNLKILRLLSALATVITFAGAPATAQTEAAIVTRIVDGDTIEVSVGGVPLTIRYIGIDTPESKKPNTPVQCYAIEATEVNRALVLGQAVTLERDKTNYDRYGRLLRYVYLADGRMVNEELVRTGAAFAKRYKPDTKYATRFEALQATAKMAPAGLWGACTVVNGATLPISGGAVPIIGAPPTATQPANGSGASGSTAPINSKDCPASHPLKGNQNSMIYHSPSQQAYNKTKPEVCFATPADAQAAGYRAAKR